MINNRIIFAAIANMKKIIQVSIAAALIAASVPTSAWWGGPGWAARGWGNDGWGDGWGDGSGDFCFDLKNCQSGSGYGPSSGYGPFGYGPSSGYGPYDPDPVPPRPRVK